MTRFASGVSTAATLDLKNAAALPRLESAAAQHTRAGLRDLLGGGEELLARFHRARAGHDQDLVAADGEAVRQLDHGALRAEVPGDELVRRADAMDKVDAVEDLEIAGVEVVARAHRAEHGVAFAGRAMDGEPEADKVLDDVLDLLFAGAFLHGHDHSCQESVVRSQGPLPGSKTPNR